MIWAILAESDQWSVIFLAESDQWSVIWLSSKLGLLQKIVSCNSALKTEKKWPTRCSAVTKAEDPGYCSNGDFEHNTTLKQIKQTS